MSEGTRIQVESDIARCDVAGCDRPVVECIGGEIYICAVHEDEAPALYDQWQAEKRERGWSQ
jgi:hypothetical protein